MDDLSREELEQLMWVFRDQSLQILEEMGHDLLKLEASNSDADAMSRLRRAAHTIKGDSACIGLDGITEIAHKIEDCFDAVLNGHIGFEARAVDLILSALDAFREAISGDSVSDVSADTRARLIQSLELLAEGTLGQPESVQSQAQGAATEALVDGGDGYNTIRREYVRVEATKIDALMNLAGEMVIARSVINQFAPELEQALPRNDMIGRFSSASAQMGKLIAELQKSVLKIRMVTIDNVFRRFARPMRELASEGGKQVKLETTGNETELDRAFVDLLYEPILHLLRNAVDHGIETVEDRVAAGKAEVGTIKMSAYHEGNQVVIEISDDGRGIDPERLKTRAVEVGALSQVQADEMEDDDALELIFLHGLSTAKEITQVSGRGIGAAAVRSVIEHLRGSVSVTSEIGKGTSFVLRMPLTLAIIRALLFSASGQLFALPLLAVTEIARASRNDIVYLDGCESYRLRDRFISLVRPGVVLGFDRRKGGIGAPLRSDAKTFFIIVLAAGNKHFGVVAESLVGEQELVIKPLESRWVQSEALAGASVLGDGKVVLIMDAEMVFRKAIKHERGKGSTRAYAV
jgi:two-component system, chemotaxis family, sensor kinase CheA